MTNKQMKYQYEWKNEFEQQQEQELKGEWMKLLKKKEGEESFGSPLGCIL